MYYLGFKRQQHTDSVHENVIQFRYIFYLYISIVICLGEIIHKFLYKLKKYVCRFKSLYILYIILYRVPIYIIMNSELRTWTF